MSADDHLTIPLKDLLSFCPNCGEKGPHLVPACLGDPSFYICEANPERVARARAALMEKHSPSERPTVHVDPAVEQRLRAMSRAAREGEQP